jgi:hypothetical protein
MATTKRRATQPHRLTSSCGDGALPRSRSQRGRSKPQTVPQKTVPQILAAAVTRDGKVLPTWPEKGTGRTAPLATCGHCGGKPLIIRRCGTEQRQRGDPSKPRPRYCAVCEKCGAHRAIQAAPGGVAI